MDRCGYFATFPVRLLIYRERACVCVFMTVVNPSTTACNSTLSLDDTGIASYVAGATSPAPGDPLDVLGDAVGTYPRSCPLRVAVRSGQTVNITLYGFGRDGGPWSAGARQSAASAAAVRRQRFCPAHVFIGEGERSQGAPLCPAGQQRTRHLYLSRGNIVTVHFSAQQRGTSESTSTTARRLFFILKMQGKCSQKHVPSVYAVIHHNTSACTLVCSHGQTHSRIYQTQTPPMKRVHDVHV